MPNLTQSYETFEKPGIVASYKMAAVKIYKGSMVGLDLAGYAVPMRDGVLFIGVASETVDNSTNSAGDKSLNVTKCGSFVFKAASGFSPERKHIGLPVIPRSDWEVGLGGGETPVGTITGIESTSTGAAGVRIRIDSHTH